jgi:hypothetical protein
MSLLPHSILVRAAEQLAAALTAAGAKLGPFKPGTSVMRTVDHDGTRWELTYMGPVGWRLTGPGVEHGTGVDAEEAADGEADAAMSPASGAHLPGGLPGVLGRRRARRGPPPPVPSLTPSVGRSSREGTEVQPGAGRRSGVQELAVQRLREPLDSRGFFGSAQCRRQWGRVYLIRMRRQAHTARRGDFCTI